MQDLGGHGEDLRADIVWKSHSLCGTVKVVSVAIDPRVVKMLRPCKSEGLEWSHPKPKREAVCAAGGRAGGVRLLKSFGAKKNPLGASDSIQRNHKIWYVPFWNLELF